MRKSIVLLVLCLFLAMPLLVGPCIPPPLKSQWERGLELVEYPIQIHKELELKK